MQKTVKTRFRGERKGILTPSLSQGEGECSDGKVEGNVVKMFFFTHTPLSGGTYPAVAGYLQRGNVAMEKRECGNGKNDENFFLFRSSALVGHIPSCCWLPSKGE